jgi:hypothetical protein
VRGREEPDPGAEPDRADPAAAPRLPEKATHDYRRNGTTTLFAALEVATGKLTDRCYDRHGKAEFGDFLRTVAKAWSWLNLVEVFFGIITRQAIRRGSFENVTELIATIRAFIDGWNDRCRPFTWTKTADEILPHAIRKRDLDAGH